MTNFQTILEELDKLYEEETMAAVKEEVPEEEPTKESLTEAPEEELFVDDEPIIEDETEEASNEEEVPEPTEAQVVLECSKCGAIVIKPDTDIKAEEETDLVNVEEACQYCEEKEGYRILGNLVPIETEAPIDEEVTVLTK